MRSIVRAQGSDPLQVHPLSEMSQFNVAQVKARALELLVKHNNLPDEMKTFYHGTILDWSDYFSENYSDRSSAEAKKLWNDIAQLWIDLASLLAALRQYKQAVQVYEDGEDVLHMLGLISDSL